MKNGWSTHHRNRTSLMACIVGYQLCLPENDESCYMNALNVSLYTKLYMYAFLCITKIDTAILDLQRFNISYATAIWVHLHNTYIYMSYTCHLLLLTAHTWFYASYCIVLILQSFIMTSISEDIAGNNPIWKRASVNIYVS